MSASGQPVLSDRPVNTMTSTASSESSQPTTGAKSMDYHRQLLQNKLSGDGDKQTYVSPSDNIVSPCTAKLAGLKNKHFMKAKPQTLFGKKSGLSTEGSVDDLDTTTSAGETQSKV